MKQPSFLNSPIIRIRRARQSNNPVLGALSLACLVLAGSLTAGTLTTDFTSGYPGATEYLKANDSTTLVKDGILKLTDTADLIDPADGVFKDTRKPLNGSYIFPDIDAGKRVASFTASFKARIGGGGEIPGNGFSFVLANDYPAAVFKEDGGPPASRVTGFVISFDTVDAVYTALENEGNDPGDAPGIVIYQKGVRVAAKRVPLTVLATDGPGQGHPGVFVPVTVELTADGLLSITYNGTKVYDKVAVGYLPIAGSFGFGAGTEAQAATTFGNFWIDDLSITTTTVTGAYVASVAPGTQNVAPDATVQIGIQDLGAGAVQMDFDGTPASPPPVKTDAGGGLTLLTYTPSALLLGSSHTVKLTYGGNTFSYNFTVASGVILPASAAAADGSVDTTKSGFKVRTYQVEAAQSESTAARAERQLAGELGPNIADLTGADASKSFTKETINFSWDGTTGPVDVGQIAGDEGIPGIPGTKADGTQTGDNAAIEVTGFLDLKAGSYTLGTVSDDSVRISIGSDPRDATAVRLVDIPIGTATATFIIQQAGIYPIRVVWSQGTGAANLELWTQDASGNKVLLNDRANAAGVKSYAQRTAAFKGPPYLSQANPGPADVNVSTRPKITLVLNDDATTVTQTSIKLSINDAVVTIPDGAITKSGTATTISFDLPQTLQSSTLQKLKLEFTDSASTPFTREYPFTTGKGSGGNVINAVKGYWTFDKGNLKATVGRDLEYVDPSISSLYKFGVTGQGDFANVPLINGKPAGVLFVPYIPSDQTDAKGQISTRIGLRMKHNIAPNGGGAKVNQYTAIFDVLWGDNGNPVGYGAVWQLHDLDAPGDSDLYWQAAAGGYGKSCCSAYTASAERQDHNQWARVVIAVDLAANPPVMAKYINGKKNLQEITGARAHVDSEFAFSIPEIHLFADSDNETSDAWVSAFQVREGRMSDDEVAALGGPDAAGIPLPYSQWDFNDPANPLAATVGNDLQYVDPSISSLYKAGVTGQGDFANVPLINGKPAGVLFIPYVPSDQTDAKGQISTRIGLRMNHGLAPNGGGAKVNQYTAIFDVLWGDNGNPVGYGAVWQLHDLDAPGDSDLYWQAAAGGYGKSCCSAYTASAERQDHNQWARVVIAVDLAANPPVMAKYINGKKNLQEITGARAHVDSEFAFSLPEIHLFADSDNETSDAWVSAFQVRQGRMSDDEVAALGGPDAAGIPSPNPIKGEWNFDDASKPLAATIGNDLLYVDPSISSLYKAGVTGQGDFANIPLINGKPAGILFIPFVASSETDANGQISTRIGLRMIHGIAPNGGGAKVNQYTAIFDLLWGENAGANGVVWQLHDLDNPGDGDLYWQKSNGSYGKGCCSAYNSPNVQQNANEWARVVVGVDLAANPPVMAKYINGIKNMQEITGTRGHVDSEFAFSIPEIHLFGDSDNETSDAYVSAIQVREGRMSDEEVAALGGPDAGGIPSASIGAAGTPTTPPTGEPPKLAVSRTGLSLTISWDAAVTGFVLEETGSLSSPVSWTATPGVVNNSVTVQIGAGSKYYRLRK